MSNNEGQPCGGRTSRNGRNVKCKFHFGLNCFTSISEMKRLVQPDPRDGRAPPDKFEPGEDGYNILRYSLDGSPARGDYPAQDPIRFEREQRVYQPTQTTHYGWLPVWGHGVVWPYWSYQHGFGGNYGGRVLRAVMRFEVSEQIEDARWGMGAGMHVHHEPPNTFAKLASAWLGINDIFSPDDVDLVEPHPSFKIFADRELGRSWQDFHAKHATLVVLTPEEHRALHSAGLAA